MSELVTPLRLVAYGTAAIVGLQLLGIGLARLSGIVVRLDGRFPRIGHRSAPRTAVPGLAFLGAGLVLLVQGVVVLAQTLA
ncbi:MAG: hypothetical protein A2Y61_05700 [Chloroflexi bacterium RBG_13_60_13]|nr:MAG: hypothetical protein A2Y61_05700 [Chloroflexi bacterium RBG_13_60_13]